MVTHLRIKNKAGKLLTVKVRKETARTYHFVTELDTPRWVYVIFKSKVIEEIHDAKEELLNS